MKITVLTTMFLAIFATFTHHVRPAKEVASVTPVMEFEAAIIEVDAKTGATVYTVGDHVEIDFEPVYIVGKAPATKLASLRCDKPTKEDLYDDAWLNACIVGAEG